VRSEEGLVSLFLLGQDSIAGLPHETGRHSSQQRRQARLQAGGLFGGQALDELTCQHFLDVAQGLRLGAAEAHEGSADGLSLMALERFCDQEGDGLCGQFGQVLPYFCRSQRDETGAREGFVQALDDSVATTLQGLQEL